MLRALLKLWTVMFILVTLDDLPKWFGFSSEHWLWYVAVGVMGGICTTFGYLLSREFVEAQLWREHVAKNGRKDG